MKVWMVLAIVSVGMLLSCGTASESYNSGYREGAEAEEENQGETPCDSITEDCGEAGQEEGDAGASSSSIAGGSSESHAGSSSEGGNGESSSSVAAERVIETGFFTDERDGQSYKWVKIGTQTWMAENLNYDYKINGTSYSSYCYNDSAKYCAQYGRLYTWAAAMDTLVTGCGSWNTCATSAGRVQGVCPNGWHLPDTAEWTVLFVAVGGSSTAGAALKATSGWHNYGNGTDDFGFSALPSGSWHAGGISQGVGRYASFWSSSEYDAYNAWDMGLNHDNAYAALYDNIMAYGFAVRCLKN